MNQEEERQKPEEPKKESKPEQKEEKKVQEEKKKPEEKPKEETKPTKEEKPKEKTTEAPTTCAKCGKNLKSKSWYYRNGKYYCNKRCWKASKPKPQKGSP